MAREYLRPSLPPSTDIDGPMMTLESSLLRRDNAAVPANEQVSSRKIGELPSLDMGEASRWQGFMLNGCR